MDVGFEDDVLAQLHRPIDVDGRGVAHGHAGAHVALVQAHAQGPLRLGELAAIVDAVERAVVLEAHGAHDAAVLAGELDQVGQVELAVRFRGRQALDPSAQPGRVEGVEARVDLVGLQLLGRGVPDLDDPLDGAELAPHHAAQLGGVGGVDGGERDRGVIEPALLHDGKELVRAHERDVAGEHDDLLGIIGNGRERGTHRVAGPARHLLEREATAVGDDVAN